MPHKNYIYIYLSVFLSILWGWGLWQKDNIFTILIFQIFKIYYFIYLKKREKLSAGSFRKWHQQSGLGKVLGWQGSKYLSQHLLPFRLCISNKLESGDDTGSWTQAFWYRIRVVQEAYSLLTVHSSAIFFTCFCPLMLPSSYTYPFK